MLAVTKSPFSVQMIASLSGYIKPCLLHPYTIDQLEGGRKKTREIVRKELGT